MLGLLLALAATRLAHLPARSFGETLGRAALRVYRTEVASSFIIRDYVRTHSMRKLQLGAGGQDMPGWLNTDIQLSSGEAYLDATKHFPLPDQSFHYVFSEHMIEHLEYEAGLAMLKECHRILVPGGKVRIATPNLLKFVELFQDKKSDEMRRYMQYKAQWHTWPQIPTPQCLILNLELREFGHQFVYDPQTLKDSLAGAGFQRITEFRPGESDDAALRGIEGRQSNPYLREVNNYETMVFEAVRP
ncbi:MAG TPA: methyltransferase domain-containing protein [Bryobacterales bacterium]|nr:methyltransferase domain-containing protein [Bryobacterales bacterium]